MKSKTQKKEELKQLKEKIPNSKIVVFTTFSKEGEKGLSVSQMTELKRALRELDSEYIIVKKSLTDLAVKNLQKSDGEDDLDVFGMNGSIGLTLGKGDDYYAVARKLYEFSKKNPALQFFGALLHPDHAKISTGKPVRPAQGKQSSEEQARSTGSGQAFIGLEAFLEIAKMPSKEILIARLLGMMKYPISGLYITLSEVAKQKELVTPVN